MNEKGAGAHAKVAAPAPSHSNGTIAPSEPLIDKRAIGAWARRHKRVWLALAVVALLVGLVGVVAMQRRMAMYTAPVTPPETGGMLSGAEYAKMDAIRRRESREIVCWGDSMTYGFGANEAYIDTPDVEYDASFKSYPEVLGHFTRLRTFNFGVVGAKSDEIVAMQASAEPPFGTQYKHFDQDVARFAQKHPGDIVILGIGSNGGWGGDYDKIIEQYQQMISKAAVGDQYLVLGDTDDPGTSAGDKKQEEFDEDSMDRNTDWEEALSDAFGDHFINMRRELIDHGLEYCGLDVTDEDLELMDRGCLSKQLRADWTHFNSFGYYAQARIVYLHGKELDLWD